MIECPNCEKTSSGSSCRLCGWSMTATQKPKVAEGYAPWLDPVYPERPAAPDVARKALAEILAIVSRMGGEDIPPGSCPTHPGGCGRSRPAVRGPA